jgi:hypothetical protein
MGDRLNQVLRIVRKATSIARSLLVDCWRVLGPVALLLLGIEIVVAGHDGGSWWVRGIGILLAGWALGMARESGEASATKKMAVLFLRGLTDGRDSTITVEHYDVPRQKAGG